MKKPGYFITLCAFILLLISAAVIAQTSLNESKGALATSPPLNDQNSNKENLPGKKINSPQIDEYLTLLKPKRPAKIFRLVSTFLQKSPNIDGFVDNSVWGKAPSVTVLDYASQRPITIKSVHTKSKIFLLVRFPDAAPSEIHKSLAWDYNEGIYKQANNREDICVIKWSMIGNKINLSLYNPTPHIADIWFWKAKRTNPIGYSDDKYQLLTKNPTPQSNPVKSQKNETYYLQRKGDAGTPAYKERFVFEYQGDVISKYLHQQPTGSRADIRAKGTWKEGYWTIEFERDLQTGHKDDLSFQIGKIYLFGISLYEITNAGIFPELSQPLYKAGDVYDHILLKIE